MLLVKLEKRTGIYASELTSKEDSTTWASEMLCLVGFTNIWDVVEGVVQHHDLDKARERCRNYL